jgi:thiol:disulfide interchange protein
MSKRGVVVSLIIAAILLVGGLIILRSEPAISPSTKTTSPGADTPTQPGNAAGAYVEYSQVALAEAKGVRILFFHASWCPQCRALEADIQKNGVPTNTTIFKVDYDKAQDLRKKHGVTLQTTVVKVDENGNLISKFTPYQKPTLENALSNL